MRDIQKFIVFLVLLFSSVVSRADDGLTYIDWSQFFRGDTLMPVYSECVPLEGRYALCRDFSVQLKYPTWVELTSQEKAIATLWSDKITDSITIESYVNKNRGLSQLNYSFIPIIKEKGHLRKLLSTQVVIVPRDTLASKARSVKHATDASTRWKTTSVLASGTWRKISITEDGMYRLTSDFLAQAGFDRNTVHLYGYGGHEQDTVIYADVDFDDLEEIPLYEAPDGSLLFWGNGLVRWEGTRRIFNAYANEATYFLTSGAARAPITTVPEYSGEIKNTVSTTLGHALIETDDYTYSSEGRNLVDSRPISNSNSATRTRTYTFTGIHSASKSEKLTVVMAADSAMSYSVAVNGSTVFGNTISAPKEHYFYTEQTTKDKSVSSYIDRSSTTADVSISYTGGATGRLDYLALNYTKSLVPEGGFVHFGGRYKGSLPVDTISGSTRYSGLQSGLAVMRLATRGNAPVIVNTRSTGGSLAFCSESSDEEYVAFNPSYLYPTPTLGDYISNQNLHAMPQVDMVIIVPSSGTLIAQAQRLAQAHKTYQNLSSTIVKADQIYNEFSSGTPDVTAYRRFLKMLYDRGVSDGTAPKYLILLGNCLSDNRMKVSGKSQNDYLLCFQSENSYSDTESYCWEDYIGLLDDGKGWAPAKSDIPDLAIGRFPVTTDEEAGIIVDKTIDYLVGTYTNRNSNRVIILGDDGDSNLHVKQANDIANSILGDASDIDTKKEYLDAYTYKSTAIGNTIPDLDKKVTDYFQEGSLMVNFTGHANKDYASHERVLNTESLKAYTGTFLPVVFTAACNTCTFDRVDESMGTVAELNPVGGSVAFIGTARTVYSDQNYTLNNLFVKYVFDKDSNGRRISLGEALRQAKCKAGSSINKWQYALMGDPAIVLGNPLNKVVVDSINDIVVSAETAAIDSIKACSWLRLRGNVHDAQGTILKDFNGTVYYNLFDSKSSVSTLGNGTNTVFQYTDWNRELSIGYAQVKNGHFDFRFAIPKDINYSYKPGRLVLFAIDDNNPRACANGHTSDFIVGGYSTDLSKDSVGPDVQLYMEDKDFIDGQKVSPSPHLIADFADEVGIMYSGIGIGHNIDMILDGDASNRVSLDDYYEPSGDDSSQGSVIYQLDSLEDGAHYIEVTAWDIMNNFTRSRVDFVVDTDIQPQMLSLHLDRDVTSGSIMFRIAYNYPGLVCDFNVSVYGISGQRLWSRDIETGDYSGIVTIPWQLYGSGTSNASNGIYICKVSCSYDGRHDTKEKKFVIYNNK